MEKSRGYLRRQWKITASTNCRGSRTQHFGTFFSGLYLFYFIILAVWEDWYFLICCPPWSTFGAAIFSSPAEVRLPCISLPRSGWWPRLMTAPKPGSQASYPPCWLSSLTLAGDHMLAQALSCCSCWGCGHLAHKTQGPSPVAASRPPYICMYTDWAMEHHQGKN